MFTVEVVSPESVSYAGEAEMVIARTLDDGDIAFQTGHVPFIGVLAVWSVDVIKESGDEVTILSDVSESRDEIDVARAQVARDAAEAAMRADGDDADAAAALQRAELRLQVAGSE